MSVLPKELPELPVLITKADVLDHAARQISRMADHIGLHVTVVDAFGGEVSGDAGRILDHIKASLPAPDLQIAAACEAAKLLHHLAAEDRILSARVAAEAARREPTRG